VNTDYYYYIPLVATINRFSLMHINEWDGNSVEVNNDGGYVYAPQIGAGHKDTATNTFTGVVMGEYVIDQENKGIGLWGFQNGSSTFGFDSKGTAYIGDASGARLEFNGETGKIYSSAYAVNPNTGMCIDFLNGSIMAPSFSFTTKMGEGDSATYNSSRFEFTLGNDNSFFKLNA
jgi:hypothetical protein